MVPVSYVRYNSHRISRDPPRSSSKTTILRPLQLANSSFMNSYDLCPITSPEPMCFGHPAFFDLPDFSRSSSSSAVMLYLSNSVLDRK